MVERIGSYLGTSFPLFHDFDSTKIFTGVNKKYFALKKKIFHLKVDVGVGGSPPRRVRARGS